MWGGRGENPRTDFAVSPDLLVRRLGNAFADFASRDFLGPAGASPSAQEWHLSQFLNHFWEAGGRLLHPWESRKSYLSEANREYIQLPSGPIFDAVSGMATKNVKNIKISFQE